MFTQNAVGNPADFTGKTGSSLLSLEGGIMTVEDLKRLDKRLRQISNPFGDGFPAFRQIMIEIAEKYKLPVTDVTVQYTAWKWRK